MSDVYAELHQAIVELKRKYPRLFYQPHDIVYRDDDGFLCVCFDSNQKPVGAIDRYGHLTAAGYGMPIYLSNSDRLIVAGDGLTSTGYVTAVDKDTNLALVELFR